MANTPKKMGRPTIMTPKIQDKLIECLTMGYSNKKACAELGIDPGALYYSTTKDMDFFQRYDTVKRAGGSALIDEANVA